MAKENQNQTTPEKTYFSGNPTFLQLLIQRKGVIFICLVVTVAVVMLVALITQREYRATAKILVEPQQEDNPYLLEKTTQFESKAFLETQKEIMVSHAVISNTLATINKKPKEKISVKEINRFLEDVEIKSRKSMGKSLFYANGIGESNILFVSVKSSNARKAKEATEALVKSYLKELSRIRLDQAKVAISILETTVEAGKNKTDQALKQLYDFEIKVGTLLPELINLDKPSIKVFPELSHLRETYESHQADIAQKRQVVSALESAVSSEHFPVIPQDVLANNPTLFPIKTNILELGFKLNEMRTLYTDNSREVINIKEQIQKSYDSLKAEILQILAGERESLFIMEKTQEKRGAILKEYDEKMKQLSRWNSQYASLKKKYTSTSDAYGKQVQKLAEASMIVAERSAKAANISIIDWPILNPTPINHRMLVYLIVSILLGLGIGIIIVLLEYMMYPEGAGPGTQTTSIEDTKI